MIDPSEIFYLILVFLHGLGAILAMGIAFGCDTGKALQSARVPERLSATTDSQSFLAAYPWDEGGEFETHQWNPFALIFLFEWLTAAFALRPLLFYYKGMVNSFIVGVFGWLAIGLLLFLAWCFTNSGGAPVAMLITGWASFLVTAWLCFFTFRGTDENTDGGIQLFTKKQHEEFRDLIGRVWKVPTRVAALRYRGLATKKEEKPGLSDAEKEYESIYGVVFRYAEYCVTAPLLFLAVVSLLVVDAPGWLFLTGFWLVLVCNALGVALHLAVCASHESNITENAGVVPYVLSRFFSTPW